MIGEDAAAAVTVTSAVLGCAAGVNAAPVDSCAAGMGAVACMASTSCGAPSPGTCGGWTRPGSPDGGTALDVPSMHDAGTVAPSPLAYPVTGAAVAGVAEKALCGALEAASGVEAAGGEMVVAGAGCEREGGAHGEGVCTSVCLARPGRGGLDLSSLAGSLDWRCGVICGDASGVSRATGAV